MKPLIRIEGVWKTYHVGGTDVHALRGLNLKIYPNEFLIIMGTSGSGKSTAMNMVGCLDMPTKGKIFLEDQDISKLSESNLASIRGKKIGFVFQAFNLIHTLTAEENVRLPLIFMGLDERGRTNEAKELLEEMGLGHRLNHTPGQLSGGELQRVAIARALVGDPDIVLADEPTGELDTKTGNEIMVLLKKMHKVHNKTVVVVTHDPTLKKYGDRVVYLQDGVIVKGGKR